MIRPLFSRLRARWQRHTPQGRPVFLFLAALLLALFLLAALLLGLVGLPSCKVCFPRSESRNVVATGGQPSSPPPPLLGVPEDFREKAAAAFQAYPRPFQTLAEGIANPQNARKNVRLYDACPALWPGPQETGDCVSMGGATAIYVRSCVAAVQQHRPPPTSQIFPPYLYGVTRVQVGNGRPSCRHSGAYPSDFIAAFQRHGYVTNSQAQAGGWQYSGSLADRWGCQGPPAELLKAGQRHAGGDAYPLRTVEEWRDALVNGYPCTVAIPWQPGRVYQGRDGRSCLAMNGRMLGGHQVCSLAYDGSTGDAYWLIFNSHGADWPKGADRRDGTPPGAVWIDATWAAWIIAHGELWAISDVPGFAVDELDLRVLDDLRLSHTRRFPLPLRSPDPQFPKGQNHATLAP